MRHENEFSFNANTMIVWACPSCVGSGYPLQVRPPTSQRTSGFPLLSLTQKKFCHKATKARKTAIKNEISFQLTNSEYHFLLALFFPPLPLLYCRFFFLAVLLLLSTYEMPLFHNHFYFTGKFFFCAEKLFDSFDH